MSTLRGIIEKQVGARVRVGAVRFRDATQQGGGDGVAAALNQTANRLRSAYCDLDVGSVPGVEEIREFFRTIGFDPSRRRPPFEVLVRRALRSQPLATGNVAADIANLISLTERLPVTLYDADEIVGDVEVRCADEGDEYEDREGHKVNLQGQLILADEVGPFGSPLCDSLRTSVRPNTRNPTLVVFAPPTTPVSRLLSVISVAEEWFGRYAGAFASGSFVLPSQ